jgi:Family of unknown function (DUF6446)
VNGKIVAGFLVISGLVAGAAIYWLQIYAFYEPVAVSSPQAAISLTTVTGVTEPLLTAGFTGIDADSSPLRFRGCFTTPTSLATLTETYATYDAPTPLIAPSWFDCFDAGTLTDDLATGTAVAFLGQANIHPGVDRVVAVYPDGRAFAWNQLSKVQEN